MGVFDTVEFDCPRCGDRIAMQSKAGPCDLRVYGSKFVPLKIAGDLSGDEFECSRCGLRGQASSLPYESVPMSLFAMCPGCPRCLDPGIEDSSRWRKAGSPLSSVDWSCCDGRGRLESGKRQ